MKSESVIDELDAKALLLEPRSIYDEAIIGIDNKGYAVYSMDKVIDCGIKEHGDYESSLEWHDYNTFGAYLGEGTPMFYSEDYED